MDEVLAIAIDLTYITPKCNEIQHSKFFIRKFPQCKLGEGGEEEKGHPSIPPKRTFIRPFHFLPHKELTHPHLQLAAHASACAPTHSMQHWPWKGNPMKKSKARENKQTNKNLPPA